MKLPNGDHAIVDPRKVEDYCLNPMHHQGRHKALVFEEALGVGRADSDLLVRALRSAAVHADCDTGVADQYGQRYTVDFVYDGPKASKMVRSGWIIRTNEDVPRLVTCYVL